MALVTVGLIGPTSAETLSDALVRAYQDNPQLNAERAKLRGTDENVPQALAGYRPQVTVGLSSGSRCATCCRIRQPSQSALLKPWTAGLTVNQTLFNGFKTSSTVRQAEAQVRAGREALRASEQGVLLDGATAYMSVLSNQSLVEAQRINVTFLRQTLDTTRTRLRVGDVPPTDVAQAEARVGRATADLNNAAGRLAVSQATYAEVIGARRAAWWRRSRPTGCCRRAARRRWRSRGASRSSSARRSISTRPSSRSASPKQPLAQPAVQGNVPATCRPTPR